MTSTNMRELERLIEVMAQMTDAVSDLRQLILQNVRNNDKKITSVTSTNQVTEETSKLPSNTKTKLGNP